MAMGRIIQSFALLVAALSSAGMAHAAPCKVDGDCPDRFACVSVGRTVCTNTDAGACTSQPITACRSEGCRRDRDCPVDMVCAQDASGSTCVPRYLLSCRSAAECGTGFDCVAAADCSEDAGGHCSNARHCALQEQSCESASDCPSHFSCAAESCSDDAGTCPTRCLPPYAATDFALFGRVSSFDARDSHYYGDHYRHRDDGWGCSVTQPRGRSGLAAFSLLLALGWLARRRRQLA